LRSFRGAALPGHSLVVYDPDLDMVVDLVPCEDAQAQEHSLMEAAQSQSQPGICGLPTAISARGHLLRIA
jgi:hypothetical protein